MKKIGLYITFYFFCICIHGQSKDSLSSMSIFYFVGNSDIYVQCYHDYTHNYYALNVFKMESFDSTGTVHLKMKDSLELKHFENLSLFIFNKHENVKYNSYKINLLNFVLSKPKIKEDLFCILQYTSKGGFGMNLSNINQEEYWKKTHSFRSFVFYYRLKRKINKSKREVFNILDLNII